MAVEAEIDAALQRVRAVNQRQVVDVLQRAHAARVVSEISVRGRDVDEGERKIRIGKRRRKRKEELANTEDRFVGNVRSRRPAPVNREVLRRAAGIYEVRRTGKNRTA